MTASTLRAAAAIIDAAAVRGKHSHWTRIADELQALADEMTPATSTDLTEHDTNTKESKRMSLSHQMGEDAEDRRNGRERRTAVAAALQEAMRNGDHIAPAAVVQALQSRRDGTGMTLEQRTPSRNLAGQTGYADDITHAPTSVEN